MKRSQLLKIGLLCAVLTVLGIGAFVYAQAPDAPFAVTPREIIPTPQNPLPNELVDVDSAIKYLLMSSPWYIVTAFIVFLVIALLRGKLKLGSWIVRIPKLSDWLDTKGSRFRFWAVIILTGIGMGFYNLSNCKTWTAKEVVITFLLGIPSGITIAFAAMGVAKAQEVHTDPKHDPTGALTAVPAPAVPPTKQA